MGEFGSFNRFVTIPCEEETYWDSAPPRVDLLWATMGLSPLEVDISTIAGAESGFELDGDVKLLLCGISAGSGIFSVPNWESEQNVPWGTLANPFSSDWWASYPFEPRFAKIAGTSDPMTRRFGTDAVSNDAGGICAAVYWITDDTYKGWGQPYTQTLSSSLGVDYSYLLNYNPIMGQRGSVFGSAQVGISLTMESQTYGQVPHLGEISKASLKTFYGVGDGFGNLIESINEKTHFPVDDANYDFENGGSPDVNGIYPPVYRVYRRMNKPRGWKYGLINALPQNTQAVFRSDRYGQFRDMLEGRKFSVFTILGDASENTIELNEQPVKVEFQRPSWDPDSTSAGNPGVIERADPANTRSGNLSMYATSSLPYFDQCWGSDSSYPFGRDRPDPIPLEIYDVVLEEY